jgi:signal transduction histidine kinase
MTLYERCERSVVFRYGLALIILVTVETIQVVVYRFIYPSVYMFSLLATILIAWTCGRWPALMAIAVSTISANYMFMEPRWTWLTFRQVRYLAYMAIFMTTASLAALGIAATRGALAQAKRELARRKQVEVEREVFLAVLGHDLRNPVSAVRMAAQLLQRRDKGCASGQDAAARIIRVTDRLTRLVDQLLDFSRCRMTGSIPVDRELVDMRDVWPDVIRQVELAAGRHSIHFSFNGDSTGKWDRDRLEQVAQNLLTNAVDHGEPSKAVQVRGRGHNGGVTVEVRNCALEPVPQEKLARLFEPFGSSGRKKIGTRSTGMGLFIARQIALAHGGDIGARFDNGEVIFAVTLPRS